MNANDIIAEYKYKTELHCHTSPASMCGEQTPSEVVRAYSEAGADTIVLTNHLYEKHFKNMPREALAEFYLRDYYDALKEAKKVGINVALGAELRFMGTKNDYLVYGISPEDIEKLVSYMDKDIYTFYREFKNEKNVIIHAHPFRDSAEPTPLGAVDGVETFNALPKHNSRIGAACRFARENNLISTGGSDYHVFGTQATCLMRTRSIISDSFDVAEAVKSQDIVFDVSGSIVFPVCVK